MKRFLFFLGVLGVSVLTSGAHPYAPPTSYLPSAKTICIAKVTALDGEKITFAVSDVLRGKNAPNMTLKTMYGDILKPKSEWLLISCPSGPKRETVGWEIFGDDDWLPAPVIRDGKAIYIQTGAFPESGIVLDKLPDGSQGLTLEHLKQLLAKQSAKN